MWGRKCDAFFQSTGRLTSLPGRFDSGGLSRQMISCVACQISLVAAEKARPNDRSGSETAYQSAPGLERWKH